MNTVQRLIFKDLLVTTLLSTAALSFVLMTESIFELSAIFTKMGATLADLGRIIVLLQPQVLVMTVPLAMLVSVLVVYGRMNADSEVVVLRTSGMGFGALAKPVFVLGLVCLSATALMSLLIAPASSRIMLGQTMATVIERMPNSIEEGALNTTLGDICIYVRSKPEPDSMEGVFISDERKGGPGRSIYAARGRVIPSKDLTLSFELMDGEILSTQGGRTTTVTFDRYRFRIPMAGMDTVLSGVSLYTVTDTHKLFDYAAIFGGRQARWFELEFHKRLSMPYLNLVLMVLGVPLALRAGRTGGLGGLVLGLMVFAAYYIMLMLGQRAVTSGKLPHYIGAWLPALAISIAAALLYRREAAR